MRILLAEDEPKLARIIARGLTSKGYAVDTIDDSEKRSFASVSSFLAIEISSAGV